MVAETIALGMPRRGRSETRILVQRRSRRSWGSITTSLADCDRFKFTIVEAKQSNQPAAGLISDVALNRQRSWRAIASLPSDMNVTKSELAIIGLGVEGGEKYASVEDDDDMSRRRHLPQMGKLKSPSSNTKRDKRSASFKRTLTATVWSVSRSLTPTVLPPWQTNVQSGSQGWMQTKMDPSTPKN